MGEPSCPMLAARLPRALDRLYQALPQEPDPSASIALALEQFQAVDVALDRSITPGQGEPGGDCRKVFLEPLGKAGQRLNPTRARFRHPRNEGGASALSHQRQEGLAQGIRLGER